MLRPNITELTDAQLLARNARKAFPAASERTPVIPGSFDGKFALLVTVVVDVNLSESQMDALETSIEAITGVHKAFVMVGPARIPIDRIPAGNDLRIGVEARFEIDPTL